MLNCRESSDRRVRRWRARAAVVASILSLLVAGESSAQIASTEYDGAAALGLALRRLGTTKRVLMIGAHPDDEQTQLLSALALGHGATVGYLSLTRGEGGQNGIGPEMQEGLGLLRTEELLAARRLDGAHQFFTRAIDYGFSKSADEAFRMWPREVLLADVVAVVRHFRPDVIVSVFSGTPRDGHGQHQAAGIMALDAFEAAADPARFPDQVTAGLAPHAAIHLYRIVRGDDPTGETAELATGQLDPLLGLSHFQVAMASRSRHRSQDMGRVLAAGPQVTEVSRAATRAPGAGSGFFAGIDTTLAMHAAVGPVPPGRLHSRLLDYDPIVRDIRASFNPLFPERVVEALAGAAEALTRAEQAAGDAEVSPDLRRRISDEREEVEHALLLASGVRFDAVADDEAVVPGQTFTLHLQLWNGGRNPVAVTSLEPAVPEGWSVAPLDPLPVLVEPNTLATRRFQVDVPADAAPTHPYFLESPREGALYVWPERRLVGDPFQTEPVTARAELDVAGSAVVARIAASFRGVDPRSGEFRRPLRVVPAASLTVEPALAVIPLDRMGAGVPVAVRVVGETPAGIEGTLALDVPAGWTVEPASVPLDRDTRGEERIVDFLVTGPTGAEAGRYPLRAALIDAAGRRFADGYELVDYPHVRPRPLYRPATIEVQAVEVVIPSGLAVAYVAAPGDEVPGALARLGVDIDLLGPEEVAAAPLDGYDAVVVGPRAYEGRPDLVTHNARFLDYVRRGGTMVVQYNQYEYTAPGIAPYPVTMSRPHDRVTDEGARVVVLDPAHPIFTTPNRITPADFEGWVQERGLYFLASWDDAYTPLLEMADPAEPPTRGALLVADHGAGRYVYTGLALFRQLPAGVPGAYRLFANLLALGADR